MAKRSTPSRTAAVKRTKSKGRKSKRGWINSRAMHLVSAGLVLGGLFVGWKYYNAHFVNPWHAVGDRMGAAAAIENYSDDVMRAATKHELDYSYLMALLMLECSGKRPAGSRFEPHVFKRLQQVRDGERSNYENVTAQHLNGASDDALKNLATSWGPFQLMGYKCILLDVNIRDIRGNNGVEHAAQWINLTYGNAMRAGNFKDCFHLHNTGQPYPVSGLPRTHDPQYVPRGLAMMKRFAPPTPPEP
ncbi:MAG: hypothetical protein RLZZ314_1057 [Bacteroidota bacterium]|jgi:hypothetical protein